MGLYDDINKLTFNRAIQISCITFGNLLAPFWFLFVMAYPFFHDLDLSKLILLSIAIGIPTTISLSIFHFNHIINADEKKRTNVFFSVIAQDSIITGLSFYIPCVATYFQHFTVATGIEFTVIMVAGTFGGKLATVIIYWIFPNKEKKIEKEITDPDKSD